MGERILVPFDGSPLARRTLQRAVTKHPDDLLSFICKKLTTKPPSH